MVQVKIQALAFSPDEEKLASLGGQDDNSLVTVLVLRPAAGDSAVPAPMHCDSIACGCACLMGFTWLHKFSWLSDTVRHSVV